MTRNGVAYELPPWEPRTDGSGSSSLLATPTAAIATGGPPQDSKGKRDLRLDLLKTPTSQLAVNGGSQHPDKRKAGGHGPTLADEVEHLPQTPLTTTATGVQTLERQVGGRGTLLPTPTTQDASNTAGPSQFERNSLPLNTAVTLLPTPTATPYGNNQSLSPGAVVRPSLDSLVQMLPDAEQALLYGVSTPERSSDGS
jgi:hypothetical protein